MNSLLILGLCLLIVIICTSICIGLIIFQIIYLYGSFKTRNSAPFVPVSKYDLEMILKYLKLSPNAKLYDLGSGDGRVLKHALEMCKDITAIGYEISPTPRIKSKISLKGYGDRVQIINQSFYEASLGDTTHIFLYLFPKVLQKLEPIFNEQLVPGVRVITVDYTFPNKQPVEVVDIAGPHKITKKIYVYVW